MKIAELQFRHEYYVGEGIDGFGMLILGMNFFFNLFGSLMTTKYLLEAVLLCQISFDSTNHLVITNIMQQSPREPNYSAFQEICHRLCSKNFIILFR